MQIYTFTAFEDGDGGGFSWGISRKHKLHNFSTLRWRRMNDRKRQHSPESWTESFSHKTLRCELEPTAPQRQKMGADMFCQQDWNHYTSSPGCNSQTGRSNGIPAGSPSHWRSSLTWSRKRSRSFDSDDKGHIVFHSGDVLRGRYEIVCTLGEGSFGKVVKCIDHFGFGAQVALKILKKSKNKRDRALFEIGVLEHLKSLKSEWKHSCVQILDWFNYHGHICISFELLGLSTYDFLMENNFQPFPMEQIRHMAYQIIQAVHHLKPENILFVKSDYNVDYHHGMKRMNRTVKKPDVKVANFGNASHDYKDHTGIVSTCYYRAPEVILGLGWDHSCDVWSIGCILIEFYLGSTLFEAKEHREHLAMMEQVLGPIPEYLLQKTKKQHYVRQSKRDWDVDSAAGKCMRKKYKPLKSYMMHSSKEHQQLFDLTEKMLKYDPAEHLALDKCLQHHFFSCYQSNNF